MHVSSTHREQRILEQRGHEQNGAIIEWLPDLEECQARPPICAVLLPERLKIMAEHHVESLLF